MAPKRENSRAGLVSFSLKFFLPEIFKISGREAPGHPYELKTRKESPKILFKIFGPPTLYECFWPQKFLKFLGPKKVDSST